jgi:hypothetical protein
MSIHKRSHSRKAEEKEQKRNKDGTKKDQNRNKKNTEREQTKQNRNKMKTLNGRQKITLRKERGGAEKR